MGQLQRAPGAELRRPAGCPDRCSEECFIDQGPEHLASSASSTAPAWTRLPSRRRGSGRSRPSWRRSTRFTIGGEWRRPSPGCIGWVSRRASSSDRSLTPRRARAPSPRSTRAAWGFPIGTTTPSRTPPRQKIRREYVAHVAKMLQLSGLDKARSEWSALAIMRLETALARGSMTREAQRDPEAIYHLTNDHRPAEDDARVCLDPLSLEARDSAKSRRSTSPNPSSCARSDSLLRAAPLGSWKAYLRWNLLANTAPALSSPFVKESFRFNSTVLQGVTEMRPRWKRCLRLTDDALGEILGRRTSGRTSLRRPRPGPWRWSATSGRAPQPARQPHLDEPADQDQGIRQARFHHQQDRVSRQLARLLQAGGAARPLRHQSAAGQRIRDRAVS